MVKKSRRGSSFSYKKRKEDAFDRASQGGGGFDSIIKQEFKRFRCKEGKHRIRILPPTFEDAEHYAISAWIHSKVGADNGTYLCLKKMGKSRRCPICEEHARAQREGDKEFADAIRPYERRIAWIIDRNNPGDGPLIYDMPFAKMDRAICAICKDPDTGATLWIDDPDDGYDVLFERAGTNMKNTVYSGHQVARRSTPISTDEAEYDAWLDYITKHPLDSVLNYYSEEHILDVLSGSAPSARPEADSDERDRRDFRAKVDSHVDDDDEDEDEPPRRRPKTRVEEEEDDDVEEEIAARARGRKQQEEEDEDEEDPDVEEPEPAPRGRPRTRARVEPELEEEDEEDEDPEEDEDEPPTARRSQIREGLRKRR